MSPVSVCASAAKKSIASAPLGTSADTASPYTLPTSRTSILASSSLCARSSCAARARTCARSCPLRSAHSFCATAAISTARSEPNHRRVRSWRSPRLLPGRFYRWPGRCRQALRHRQAICRPAWRSPVIRAAISPDASHGATAKTRRHDCGHNLTLRRAARLRQAGRSHFREQADDRGHRRHG